MKTTIILLIFISAFAVRLSRWLSRVQQKEYRLDRMILYLKTKEGVKELLRLLPISDDFTRHGFIRPRVTPRIMIISLLFLLVTWIFYKFYFGISNYLVVGVLNGSLAPSIFNGGFLVVLIFGLVLYLILIPFLVMLSVVPTALIASVGVHFTLVSAAKIFRKGSPKVIGITGSYGKTSTKLLLTHVLSQKYSVFKTPKSFNTKYSVARSILKNYKNEQIAIIEYAAYKKGEIKVLTDWFQPDIAVITGLTEQHLGLFGSLEEIINAKAELVASLKSGSTVICNAYNPDTLRIYEEGTKGKKLRKIEVRPNVNQFGLDNEGRLLLRWQNQKIRTKFIGLHYTEVIETVRAICKELGLSDDEIFTSISRFVPDDKFIYAYLHNNGAKIISDGDTSNPKGFEAVINLAKHLKFERKILITAGIVDLGERSSEIHLNLAKKSKRVFDRVMYVGESGKKEFEEIFGQALMDKEVQWQAVVKGLTKDDLLVVEGKIPSWAKKEL
jgi:UDP-N-acetylmuramoyl-tripeptide--D-alanyl-D-alanine ligase